MTDIEIGIMQYEKLISKVIKELKYIPSYVDKHELRHIAKIAVWQGLVNYDDEKNDNIITYLYEIIRFRILDYLIKMKKQCKNLVLVAEPNEKRQGETFLIDNIVNSSLLKLEIMKIVPNKRNACIFISRYADNFQVKELAKIYSLSDRHIRNILNDTVYILRNTLNWDTEEVA